MLFCQKLNILDKGNQVPVSVAIVAETNHHKLSDLKPRNLLVPHCAEGDAPPPTALGHHCRSQGSLGSAPPCPVLSLLTPFTSAWGRRRLSSTSEACSSLPCIGVSLTQCPLLLESLLYSPVFLKELLQRPLHLSHSPPHLKGSVQPLCSDRAPPLSPTLRNTAPLSSALGCHCPSVVLISSPPPAVLCVGMTSCGEAGTLTVAQLLGSPVVSILQAL